MMDGWGRVRRLCARAILLAALALFAALTLAGLFVTAHLGKHGGSHEAITFTRDGVAGNVMWVAVILLALRTLCRSLSRVSGVRLGGALLGAWTAGTLVLVLGAGVRQMYDFAYVLEGAELFAQGNYKPMTIDYFHVYSYQLGICLPMEIVKRLLPGVNLSLLMQGLNVLLSAGTAGAMAALCGVLFSPREAKAALLLYVGMLPMALYCIFVYGTLPMLFCCALAMLCFALYIRRRQARFGVGYALCIAAAYVLKPNAAVPVIAVILCALLDTMTSRDARALAYAALGAVLGVALLKLVQLQYELRSGVTLTGDVSMLARMAMGMQEGGAAAGWFNRYTEQFFPFEVTAEQERATASADIRARLSEFAADPAMALAFLREKLLSQWLEPSYTALWYGDLCEHTGALAGVTKAIFEDGGAIRAALTRYMALYQKALYALSCAGLFALLRRRGVPAAALVLPLCALGGMAYHMLFEAKSQYIYMYAMLMMPVAALGLTELSAWTRRGAPHGERSAGRASDADFRSKGQIRREAKEGV